VLYHDGNTNTFDYMKMQGSEEIKLEDFIKFLSERIALMPASDIKERCEDLNISPKPADYYPAAKVLKNLQNKYPLIYREIRSFLE
jgi:hypothetical protein